MVPQTALPIGPHARAGSKRVRPAARTGTKLLQPVHRLDDGSLCATVLSADRGSVGRTQTDDAATLLGLACREIRASGAGAALPVLVSLPAGTILAWGPGLADLVHATLQRTGAEPGLLDIGLLDHPCEAAGAHGLLTISALLDLGVGVSVDGLALPAAEASLLPRMPVTAIRLHQGVARDLPHDRAMRAALTSVIRAAREQDARIVAQGVQTALQRDILTDLGCDQASGPLFGPPMQEAAFRSATGG